MISILAPVWRQFHDTIVMKPPVSFMQLTVLTISHHMSPLQNKVRCFYFSFACFTWFLGLLHKNWFLPTNMKPKSWLADCCFESLLRTLRCRYHIHYNWRNWHPASHFYTVHAVCQAWNQSRVKRVKSVTGRFNPTMPWILHKYTLEGNNEVINARIHTMRSNRTSILRIDRLWYHCWGSLQITKKLFPTEPRIAEIYLSSSAVTINRDSDTYPHRPIAGITPLHMCWWWSRHSRPQGREELNVTMPRRLGTTMMVAPSKCGPVGNPKSKVWWAQR
jgi:hypothetical protein